MRYNKWRTNTLEIISVSVTTPSLRP